MSYRNTVGVRRQDGFALLIVMASIFSVGSLALVLVTSQGMGNHAPHSSLMTSADQSLLIDARQNLLSYAAMYPWLYGPQGAGPGHLPCPDTDNTTSLSPEGGNQRSTGDSPNPPCGRSSVATGLLPRHVRLTDQRYAFHMQPEQLASYRVSGRVINNPVNRLVNPGFLDDSATTAPAAVIEVPVKSVASTLPGARVTINFETLVAASMSSVAAWLMEKSEALAASWCGAIPPLDNDSSSLPEGLGSISALQCDRYVELARLCPQYQALYLVLDRIPDTSACVSDELRSWRIDGVPATRHWFVRNQWSQWISFFLDESCSTMLTTRESCKLTISDAAQHAQALSDNDHIARSSTIRMTWMPRGAH